MPEQAILIWTIKIQVKYHENSINYGKQSKLYTAINFINLLYTKQDKGNSKNKAECRKMGMQIFTMYFNH